MLISICTLVPEFNGLVSKRAKRKRGLFALYASLNSLHYKFTAVGLF